MDIQNFIANFAEQFDDIDVAELHSDTIFHELDGWTHWQRFLLSL